MPASYPAAIKSWSQLQDGVDVAQASNVNTAYDEITAIETELGTTPKGAAASVAARLAAIEAAVQTSGYYFVSMGDIAAPHKQIGDVTFDGTWRTLDISAIVPAGCVRVLVSVATVGNAGGLTLSLCKKGHSNRQNCLNCRTQVNGVWCDASGEIEVDSNRCLEYNAPAAVSGLWLVIRGYWK